MNWKTLGDLAQNCSIGELSKYGLGVAFPLSDNYPFDLIVIANNNLFKVQVRGSSSKSSNGSLGDYINFKLSKNNFYSGIRKKYEDGEVDVFALYDLDKNKLHIIPFKDLKGRSHICIRYDSPQQKNNGTNYSSKTEISKDRVKEVFNFDVPKFEDCLSKRENPQFDHICVLCNQSFRNGCKKSRFCSVKCSSENQRKVQRPSKEQLLEDIDKFPMIHIGAKYGVSDNAIRKWLKFYKVTS